MNKKLLYLHIFFIFFKTFFCQNLVPNPSFEIYSSCPTGNSQIELAIPWNAATNVSSSDYYNSCSSIFGVPNAYGEFQNAHTGNSFAGFTSVVSTTSTPTQREYIQVKLINPLIQNKIYYVEFFVNLRADNNLNAPANDIAANFSINRPFCANTYDLLSLTPHIMLPGNPIINDTLNWVKIWGCYTAQGGEEYLTIGNFFDNNHTQTTATVTSSAYYFVDDVKVEEITGTCTDNIQETIYTKNIIIYPNPGSGEFTVQWKGVEKFQVEVYNLLGEKVYSSMIDSGIKTFDVKILSTGTYVVKLTGAGGEMKTERISIIH